MHRPAGSLSPCGQVLGKVGLAGSKGVLQKEKAKGMELVAELSQQVPWVPGPHIPGKSFGDRTEVHFKACTALPTSHYISKYAWGITNDFLSNEKGRSFLEFIFIIHSIGNRFID